MNQLALDKIRLLKDLDLQTNDFQDEVNSSNARFKIVRAARRIGKSYVAAKDVLADVLTPNTRGWIVGPSYDLAEKEFRYILDFLMRAHKKIGLPKPIKVRDNAKAGELYIEMPWGAEVHGKSADRPLSLVGEENDWIILSEAAQHNGDTWFRYLRPTLSTRLGRAIFPTTPDLTGLWLYEIETRVNAGHLEGWEVFHCAAWDTPHFDKNEIESARIELSDDAFQEQFGGEWVFYTGRVYKPFKSHIHLIEPFVIPASWPVREGIDFGTRDATAVEFAVEAPTRDFYFVDEHYASDLGTDIHVRRTKEIEKRYSKVTVRISDHHALGLQLANDWGRYGCPSVSCEVPIKARRDRFLSYLEPKSNHRPWHLKESGPNPRIFIFKGRCPNLERELQFLRWKSGSRKEGTYGDTIGDDHGISAAEYMIYYATKGYVGTPKARPWRTQGTRKPASSMTGY